MTTSRPPRILTAGALAAGLGASLVGCAQLEQIQELQGQPEFAFSTAQEARASEESHRIPELLPDDAADVTLHVDFQRVGANLRFSSEGGIVAEYCSESPIGGDTVLETEWWPEVPAEGWDCGRWLAFEEDGTYFAWDQGPDAEA